MNKIEKETDVLVVGSGGGGMTAAITAKDAGCDSMVIEKAPVFGGSTAMSGGAIWAPCNHLMKSAGINDSPEEAFKYMQTITKGRVSDERLKAYIRSIPEMVKFLEEKTHVCFMVVPEYPDYYPDVDGSTRNGGRTIEPVPFNGFTLGSFWHEQRPMPDQSSVFGMIHLTAYEFHLMFDTSLKGRLHALRFIASYFLNPSRLFAKRKDSRLTLGSALTARLRKSLSDRDIPLWLNTRAKKFIVDQGRVVGVEVEKDEKTIRIMAKKGVVMASGGFEHNLAMREKYQNPPVSDQWTVGNDENVGDAITMGIEVDAGLDFMEESWGMSTSPVPGLEIPYMVLVERSLAGSIVVNSAGKRFCNEAGPYIEVVNAQRNNHSEEQSAIPAYLIVDSRYSKKYPLGPIMPGASPKKYIESGYVKSDVSIKGLAEQFGIDPEGLAAQVEKYNENAIHGSDPEFEKGKQPIDRYYTDPSVKPNSCVAPVDMPPYYAIEIWPGDLGTKGGLNTDEYARVLNQGGQVIEGLYAIGNCSASVMGATYAGAGGTIGPSMTFGYIAAKHAAGSS